LKLFSGAENLSAIQGYSEDAITPPIWWFKYGCVKDRLTLNNPSFT
jgi:hypothetical protein